MVGIFPVRPPEIRERRLNLKVDMSLEELLDNYFKSKPELKDKRAALVLKALQLAQEIDDASHE
jgi:hypothetical protein